MFVTFKSCTLMYSHKDLLLRPICDILHTVPQNALLAFSTFAIFCSHSFWRLAEFSTIFSCRRVFEGRSFYWF